MSTSYSVSVYNTLQTAADSDKIRSMFGFGEKLRGVRKAKGFSQERLAEMMDYQRTNLVNIEAGRKKASDDVLRKLAAIPELEITYEELKAWQAIDEYGPEVLNLAAGIAKFGLDEIAKVYKPRKEKK